MDQGRGRGDRVYRARVTLGERLLRKLQRPFQGRTLEWGDILYPKRSPDRHRTMAKALQHYAAALSSLIQNFRTLNHRTHGRKRDDAPTFRTNRWRQATTKHVKCC